MPEEAPEPAPTAEKEPIPKPEPVVEAPSETVSPPTAPRKPAPKLQDRPKPSRKPVRKAPKLANKPQVSSASFTESLLRNLDDESGPRNEKAHEDQSELSSIERDRLAARLGDAIQSQLKPCWNIPAGAKDAANMKVAIHIRLNPDGSLNGPPRIADTRRLQQDSFLQGCCRKCFAGTSKSRLRAVPAPLRQVRDLEADLHACLQTPDTGWADDREDRYWQSPREGRGELVPGQTATFRNRAP